MTIPDGLRYTAEHEWVRRTGSETVQVGITDFAQSSLGDVVYVQLPDEGAAVTAGEPFGEVESTKSVSDLFAPVSGTVSAVNGELEGSPQLVNSDPYEAGWLLDVQVADVIGPHLHLVTGSRHRRVDARLLAGWRLHALHPTPALP